MARLIDADALKKEIADFNQNLNFRNQDYGTGYFSAFSVVKGMLAYVPTVDAVPVVHGAWDDSGRYRFASGKKAIRCNICGCALSEGEYHCFNWNYCPVCGAKMDLEVE